MFESNKRNNFQFQFQSGVGVGFYCVSTIIVESRIGPGTYSSCQVPADAPGTQDALGKNSIYIVPLEQWDNVWAMARESLVRLRLYM